MSRFYVSVSLLIFFSCSGSAPPTTEIIPLLFRGERVESSNGRYGFVYRSHPIYATPARPVTAYINQLHFHNWTCEWMLENQNSRIALDSEHPVDLTTQSTIRGTLYYTGPLDLSAEDVEHCRPRLLAVTADGISRRAQPFNVAIILVDAMRPDHLPGKEFPFIIAPHLANMRALGTEFTNWHGTSSSSRPSIGSIFTGLYPRAHGAIRHTTASASLFPKATTLAQVFRSAGFRTAGFHSNAQIAGRYGFDRGFEIYKGPIWDPDVTKESLRWLSNLQHSFFLYVHFIRLHSPYRPTEYYDRFYRDRTGDREHDQYCAEITLVDQSVGEFLLGLAERKLLGNTLLWFLSDHGEEFLEHGGRYHGRTLYEESIRTLSIVVYPRLVRGGVSIPVLGSHVDIVPTLLSLSALQSSAPTQGCDLSNLAQGKDGEISERSVFAQSYGGENSDPLVSIRDAVISGRWKLIVPSQGRNVEYYDLFNDPGEKQNLFAPENANVERLLSQRDEFMKSSDGIAEQLGRAKALEEKPVVPSDKELENLRDLGYIR